jgi:hypothetical protein
MLLQAKNLGSESQDTGTRKFQAAILVYIVGAQLNYPCDMNAAPHATEDCIMLPSGERVCSGDVPVRLAPPPVITNKTRSQKPQPTYNRTVSACGYCPNGHCEGAECVCNLGWFGRGCLYTNCAQFDYCNQRGNCLNRKCECLPTWKGPNCTIRKYQSNSYC